MRILLAAFTLLFFQSTFAQSSDEEGDYCLEKILSEADSLFSEPTCLKLGESSIGCQIFKGSCQLVDISDVDVQPLKVRLFCELPIEIEASKTYMATFKEPIELCEVDFIEVQD